MVILGIGDGAVKLTQFFRSLPIILTNFILFTALTPISYLPYFYLIALSILNCSACSLYPIAQ